MGLWLSQFLRLIGATPSNGALLYYDDGARGTDVSKIILNTSTYALKFISGTESAPNPAIGTYGNGVILDSSRGIALVYNQSICLRGNDTRIEVVPPVRASTALYRRKTDLTLTDPGSTGATPAAPGANTLGGWQLDATGEEVSGRAKIFGDWDGTAPTIAVQFQANAAGSAAGDVVQVKLTAYYAASGDTAIKTQNLTDDVTVGACSQYDSFEASFSLDPSAAGNPIEAGDTIALVLNIVTTNSDVTDMILNNAIFYYNTQCVEIESTQI